MSRSVSPLPVASAGGSGTGGGASGRLHNVTAYLPFVYGSIASYLGNKQDQYATHKWRLYVRDTGTSREQDRG